MCKIGHQALIQGIGNRMNQLLAMRVFVRVVESGSFSRTAAQLELPRSTISKLISDLETHLQIKLLNRTTRKVATTAEGLAYYHQSVRLIAELDTMDNNARITKQKLQGHLRVDVPSTFATHLLVPALVDFQQRYPEITVSLGVSDKVVDIVGEGVDCVIRAGRINEQSMIGRRLTELDYITCASPSYIQRYGAPSHPRDLESHHRRLGYFAAATDKPLSQIWEKGAERVEMNNGSYCANDGNGLLAMMLAGLGIGQHFDRCLQPYIERGELVPVLTDWSQPSLPFHVLYPPSPHQSARLKVFIEWLLTTFRSDNQRPTHTLNGGYNK